MLLRLKGIKEEYPPLIASLRPLVDVAKRVDGLLNKIRKEEDKFDIHQLARGKRERGEGI